MANKEGMVTMTFLLICGALLYLSIGTAAALLWHTSTDTDNPWIIGLIVAFSPPLLIFAALLAALYFAALLLLPRPAPAKPTRSGPGPTPKRRPPITAPASPVTIRNLPEPQRPTIH